MKKTIFALTVIISSIILSCNSGKLNPINVKTENAPSTVPAMADFTKSYSGTLNNKYKIEMTLNKTGNSISGNYKYSRKENSLKISGTIDNVGNFTINEFNDNGSMTGIFKGQLTDNKAFGQWSIPDGSKTMPFSIYETNTNSNKGKKEIIEKTRGVYNLNSISGLSGANTLFDTQKEKGKWSSSSSVNIGGTREEYKNNLSKLDILLLNSMRIEIDENLTIRLFSGENQLLESAFNENGMDYRIKEKSKEKMNEKLAILSSSTIFQKKNLIILADDQIDFSNTLEGNFDITTSDNLILSYSVEDNSFLLDIFIGGCCDNSTLTFTKK